MKSMKAFAALAALLCALALAAAVEQPQPTQPQPTAGYQEMSYELSVEELAVSPKSPVAGGNASVVFMIKNNGPDPFDGRVLTRLLVDGSEVYSREESYTIAVGEMRTFESKKAVIFKTPGQHTLTLEMEFGGASIVREITVSVSSPDKGVTPAGQKTGTLTIILAVAALIAVVALFVVLYAVKRKTRTAPAQPPVPAQPVYAGPSELDALRKKKQELEEMIKIAKVKFYKRAIDEESYKEIVTENQKKLIEIEARIGELEGRVARLEQRR